VELLAAGIRHDGVMARLEVGGVIHHRLRFRVDLASLARAGGLQSGNVAIVGNGRIALQADDVGRIARPGLLGQGDGGLLGRFEGLELLGERRCGKRDRDARGYAP
jgi:hypothetical protein